MKALAAALGFAFIAHSPHLSAALLPTLGAAVVAEAAYVVSLARRRRTAR